eukprot:2488516-Rhodomonas_salina.2
MAHSLPPTCLPHPCSHKTESRRVSYFVFASVSTTLIGLLKARTRRRGDFSCPPHLGRAVVASFFASMSSSRPGRATLLFQTAAAFRVRSHARCATCRRKDLKLCSR